MSKASDYMDKMRQLIFKTRTSGRIAYVNEDGKLEFEGCELNPKDALRLGKWILATFGED